LVIVSRTHTNEPIKLKNTLLTEDCEVIRTLLAGRYNEDLFVFIIPEGPQHKGSSNPGLTKTPKRLDL
jgi:hypothetical protein